MLIKGRSDADSNDFQFPYTPLLIGEIQLYEIDNILRETGSFVNPPMVGICIPRKGDFQGIFRDSAHCEAMKPCHVLQTLLNVQVEARLIDP